VQLWICKTDCENLTMGSLTNRPMRQLYAGPRLRLLRSKLNLSQRQVAGLLNISVSYLSQIESGDRPITASVLDTLSRQFPADWGALDSEGEAQLLIRAVRALNDPSIPDFLPPDNGLQRTISRNPLIASRLVALHEAVERGQEQLRALDDRVADGTVDHGRLPWEEVRDWFHDERNYIDAIDRAAEEITGAARPASARSWLEFELQNRFGVKVRESQSRNPALRHYDQLDRVLLLDPTQPPETSLFSLAHLLARLQFRDLIERIAHAGLGSEAGRQLLSAGLTNYAAGAILMPYGEFREEARTVRHDIDRLRQRFGTSFEQTCHRLSTLQRPGSLGVPFFFCRIDMAGNVTKRHSATRLQFARFGGACPLWIVHEAVAIPDRILVQLAETPDGVRYVSMAKGLVKPSGSYSRPPRRYAVALGCEVEHATDFVYADHQPRSGDATPIGVSCRICPRTSCDQRAYPPAVSVIRIDPDRRGTVPYELD
jgi:predicted transcriptional regulator/DNA-binding XRE family transcriptional regulator